MNELEKNNAFKKIIPKDKLTEKDKQAVMKTIANTKLFLEVFDLLSVKHLQTRIKVIETMGGVD